MSLAASTPLVPLSIVDAHGLKAGCPSKLEHEPFDLFNDTMFLRDACLMGMSTSPNGGKFACSPTQMFGPCSISPTQMFGALSSSPTGNVYHNLRAMTQPKFHRPLPFDDYDADSPLFTPAESDRLFAELAPQEINHYPNESSDVCLPPPILPFIDSPPLLEDLPQNSKKRPLSDNHSNGTNKQAKRKQLPAEVLVTGAPACMVNCSSQFSKEAHYLASLSTKSFFVPYAADDVDDKVVLGAYTRGERRQKIERFREKRHRRNFNKKIMYRCRQNFAQRRPRVSGRFVKLTAEETNQNPLGAMCC